MADKKVKNDAGSKGETYSYKGWLISDNFLKRAFAVYGYSFVAGLIVSIPFLILIFILMMMIGFTNNY